MLGLLAEAGVRNLSESRAAGGWCIEVRYYHIHNVAVGFRYYVQIHCTQAGRDITANCTDFSCCKGSGMRETKFD